VEEKLKYPYKRRPRPGQLLAMKRCYRRQRQLVIGKPGTGKTKVALDFIGVLLHHKKIKRALVVGPLMALVGVWEEQIEIDVPWIKYHLVRPKKKVDWAVPLLLVNYDYFRPRRRRYRSKRTGEIIGERTVIDRSILQALIDWEPDVVILDESHKIKNPKSKNAKAAHRLCLVPRYVMLLTGTPKGNKRVLDLWSQFQAVQPGLLDETFDDFKDHYCIWGGFGGYEFKKFRHIPHLAKIIRPYVARLKEEELPPQVDIPIRIDLTPRARELYQKMEKDFLVDVTAEYKKLKQKYHSAKIAKQKVITTPIVLSKIIKLRQICGGFIRDEEGTDIWLHNCKLEALKEIMDDLKESGVKRVVIYATFKTEIKKIREWLTDWVTFTIDGDTPIEQRKLAIQIYNTSGGAMICQTATGSESLNLQAGNYEIDYSTDHSFINYSQRRKRIHRPPQKKKCYYYQLKCKGTIEPDIYRGFQKWEADDRVFMEMLDGIKERNL
jgi:SNF2 family DNA or RNA helicase